MNESCVRPEREVILFVCYCEEVLLLSGSGLEKVEGNCWEATLVRGLQVHDCYLGSISQLAGICQHSQRAPVSREPAKSDVAAILPSRHAMGRRTRKRLITRKKAENGNEMVSRGHWDKIARCPG